jgi:hypothetical protein
MCSPKDPKYKIVVEKQEGHKRKVGYLPLHCTHLQPSIVCFPEIRLNPDKEPDPDP